MTQFSKKFKLSNGLTVIFERNNNADVVSLNIGVRVGAANEKDHESGICHLIEHMVFKGTKTYQAGEIATIVEANGGELNAYTSLDQTVYYINLPAKSFGLGLNILKEMVFDAQMDETELEREKEVVVEEIRRGKDSPQRVLSELLFTNFFTKHPYGRPVIGTEAHVRGFSQQKVKEFYKKHYVPQNMVLGVCGNITEDQLSQEIEKLFRHEVHTPIEHQAPAAEPVRTKPQILTKTMEINATFFDVAFSVPELSHKDVPALDILSHLLGEADTSLLEQNTRERDQLVHYIYSSCFTPKSAGIFAIGGQVDPKKINGALASIREQIEWTKVNLFDSDKLERAKQLVKAQMIFDKETCEGTARKWMTYETVLGDYNYDEKYIEQVDELTCEDLRAVANKYLDATTSMVVVLHPPKEKIKINKSFFSKSFKIKKTKKKPLRRKKDVNIYELSNGIRVVLKENHRLPIVSSKLVSLGGVRYETTANNGISVLLSNVLTRGSENYNQLQIAEKCERLAAHLGAYAGRNSWGMSFSILSSKFREGMPFFSDIILNPLFEKEELVKEKRLHLESIKNRQDSPTQLAFMGALEKVFQAHPYSRTTLGTAKTVKSLTSEKINRFYESLRTPNNMVFSMVGDFDSMEVLDVMEENFYDLPRKKFQNKKMKKPAPLKKQERLFTMKNKNQAHVVVGFQGVSIYDKDRYVLDVIHNILSGQGGRLFLELRDKQSLAYTVTSTVVEGLETGFFGAYIGTEPSKVQTALDGIYNELDKLCQKKVPADELKRAKQYIIGNHEIDHQKNGAQAMQFALNELYGKPIDEFFDFHKDVNKVTANDVQRVARKFFNPKNSVISVVGPKGCFKK